MLPRETINDFLGIQAFTHLLIIEQRNAGLFSSFFEAYKMAGPKDRCFLAIQTFNAGRDYVKFCHYLRGTLTSHLTVGISHNLISIHFG